MDNKASTAPGNSVGASLPPFALDDSRIHEFSNGDARVLAKLTEAFLSDLERRLPQLEECLREQIFEAGVLRAHSIAGSCANFGASSMATLARGIEQRLSAGNWDGTEELFQALLRQFGQARLQLQKYLQP